MPKSAGMVKTQTEKVSETRWTDLNTSQSCILYETLDVLRCVDSTLGERAFFKLRVDR